MSTSGTELSTLRDTLATRDKELTQMKSMIAQYMQKMKAEKVRARRMRVCILMCAGQSCTVYQGIVMLMHMHMHIHIYTLG